MPHPTPSEQPHPTTETLLLPVQTGELVVPAEAAANIPSRMTVLKLGGAALARTVANTAITVADAGGTAFMAGEVASLLADAAKISKQVGGIGIDLTPDVDWKVAATSELLEPLSFGFIPTHIIETVMQLKHDIPRMGRAFLALVGVEPKAHWYDPPKVRKRAKH